MHFCLNILITALTAAASPHFLFLQWLLTPGRNGSYKLTTKGEKGMIQKCAGNLVVERLGNCKDTRVHVHPPRIVVDGSDEWMLTRVSGYSDRYYIISNGRIKDCPR
jgi:hypothetical protein